MGASGLNTKDISLGLTVAIWKGSWKPCLARLKKRREPILLNKEREQVSNRYEARLLAEPPVHTM